MYPEAFLTTIREVAERYPNDIALAVEEAEAKLRKLPEFKQWIETMITSAIREMVYDDRHRRNVEIKRQTGYYGGPGKVSINDVAGSTIENVYKSVYDYSINSQRLGDVLGKDLIPIAEKEEEISKGHQFNARLMRWLKMQGVTHEKKVREVVPEKKLRINFDRLLEECRNTG